MPHHYYKQYLAYYETFSLTVHLSTIDLTKFAIAFTIAIADLDSLTCLKCYCYCCFGQITIAWLASSRDHGSFILLIKVRLSIYGVQRYDLDSRMVDDIFWG